MLLAAGYETRFNQQRERDAFMLAHLLQPYSKEKLSIDHFLKGKSESRGGWEVITEEEWEAHLQRKQQVKDESARLPSWL